MAVSRLLLVLCYLTFTKSTKLFDDCYLIRLSYICTYIYIWIF